MSELPLLTLKRCSTVKTPELEVSGETASVMHHRKTVVVATPAPRKQKKQMQKDAEKTAETERKAAVEEERRRQWLLKNSELKKARSIPTAVMVVTNPSKAMFTPMIAQELIRRISRGSPFHSIRRISHRLIWTN